MNTAYTLAKIAGVASPDNDQSPGATWLRQVEAAWQEATDWAVEHGDSEPDWSDLADSLVPVYTHNRWLVFVDLAAYSEDITELVGQSFDLETAAEHALYLIAERLMFALAAEAAA